MEQTVRTEVAKVARKRRTREPFQPAVRAVSPEQVSDFVAAILGEDIHAATVASVTDGVVGILNTVIVTIHAIGRAMALAYSLEPKHATKQFDRLLSNAKFDVWAWFSLWVPYVIGSSTDVLVALDWTEFDADDHATLAAYVVTSHGRATPLLWKSVVKSKLRHHRGRYERELVERLEEVIPEGTRVTLLADRGFADQKFFAYLEVLGWFFVIRFKQGTHVAVDGAAVPAVELIPSNGNAKMLRDVEFTAKRTPLAAVVLKHQKGMKEAWCLATNRRDLGAGDVVGMYARRFTIEETFRDIKDVRFGLGLSATHIGDINRRDRLLFVLAIAQVLLTLLGAAGEAAGLDRYLKVNTSKKRTLSLFNQGLYWYSAIPTLRRERLVPLLQAFAAILQDTAPIARVFGPK